MQKNTPDYDNVFKTMKSKHKRLFISVINDIFGKEYPMDAKVEVLPSEGYLTEDETADGSSDIKEQISDFLMKIGNEVYLLECQSYDDGSMAVRIAEYALGGRQMRSISWNAFRRIGRGRRASRAVSLCRREAVRVMGYWPCGHPNAEAFRHLR